MIKDMNFCNDHYPTYAPFCMDIPPSLNMCCESSEGVLVVFFVCEVISTRWPVNQYAFRVWRCHLAEYFNKAI